MKKVDLMKVHISVLLFGAAGLFGKTINASASVIVFGRVFFAGLFLLAYLLFRSEKINIDSAKDYFLIILSGVLLAFHWQTFFYSIQISTVAVGLLSFSTFPIFVALIEPLVGKAKFEISFIMLSLLVLLGLAVMVSDNILLKNDDSLMRGISYGIVSGFLFALIVLLNRSLVARNRAVQISFLQYFTAILVLLPFSYREIIAGISLVNWWQLLVLGAIFTAFSHTLFIAGLKTVRASVSSIICCLEPVYGIILAVIILQEIPKFRVIIGGLIVLLCGFYVSTRKKYRNAKYK